MRVALRETAAPTLALFASVGTLFCCAIPALLVTLGMGAVVAGLVSAAPWLATLSAHKGWLFAAAGGLLLLAGGLRWAGRNAPCPADPKLARACARLRAWGEAVYWTAVVAFGVGVFFAYVAPKLLG